MTQQCDMVQWQMMWSDHANCSWYGSMLAIHDSMAHISDAQHAMTCKIFFLLFRFILSGRHNDDALLFSIPLYIHRLLLLHTNAPHVPYHTILSPSLRSSPSSSWYFISSILLNSVWSLLHICLAYLSLLSVIMSLMCFTFIEPRTYLFSMSLLIVSFIQKLNHSFNNFIIDC